LLLASGKRKNKNKKIRIKNKLRIQPLLFCSSAKARAQVHARENKNNLFSFACAAALLRNCKSRRKPALSQKQERRFRQEKQNKNTKNKKLRIHNLCSQLQARELRITFSLLLLRLRCCARAQLLWRKSKSSCAKAIAQVNAREKIRIQNKNTTFSLFLFRTSKSAP
jgi:hypothetical protein